tara:strand:- start:1096 stop:1479 length:384 start_codon:yes stop_codon:yes gene_type:complete
MKVYYARITNDYGENHYVVNTVKRDVFLECKKLIDSGDYWCEDGEPIIEQRYFNLSSKGVLDGIQFGSDLGGNCNAILWIPKKEKNKITKKKNSLAILIAKQQKVLRELSLEHQLAMERIGQEKVEE